MAFVLVLVPVLGYWVVMVRGSTLENPMEHKENHVTHPITLNHSRPLPKSQLPKAPSPSLVPGCHTLIWLGPKTHLTYVVVLQTQTTHFFNSRFSVATPLSNT